MKVETVFSSEATVPRGPYSQAIKISNINSLVFTGTIASLDKDWNIVGAGDIEAQTRKTIENLEQILIAAGGSLKNIVKTTWYLVNISDMPLVAKVRNEMFQGCNPASGTIPVNKLYYDELLLEMEAIAVI